jgi:hypothetical protein
MSPTILIPYGIFGNDSVKSFCLLNVLGEVGFSLVKFFHVDVPTISSWFSSSYSSTSKSCWHVISSNCTSSGCCSSSTKGYVPHLTIFFHHILHLDLPAVMLCLVQVVAQCSFVC